MLGEMDVPHPRLTELLFQGSDNCFCTYFQNYYSCGGLSNYQPSAKLENCSQTRTPSLISVTPFVHTPLLRPRYQLQR